MITNFYPLGVPAETFQIQSLPYSADRLRELRKDYNSEYSFFGFEGAIYISPHSESAAELGKPTSIDRDANPELVCSLMRHMIFRGFREKYSTIVPTSFAPLEFRSRSLKHDPVREGFAEDASVDIGYPRVIRVDVTSIVRKSKPRFGVLISYRNMWDFSISVEELINDGYDVLEKEVLLLEQLPGLMGILSPKESLLGKVVETGGPTLKVQTNSGIQDFNANEVILNRTNTQITDYLRYKVGETACKDALKRKKTADSEKTLAGQMVSEIGKVAKWLGECRFRNADGFVFYFNGDNQQSNASYTLSQTRLIFDYGPSSSNPNPFMGMVKHGPFDSGKFSKKAPHVLLVYRDTNRAAMTEFFGRLKDGMPTEKYFGQGMKGLCALHDITHTLCPVSGESPDDYEKAVEDAVRDNEASKFDIALIECSDESMSLSPNESPYLRTKAKLMAFGLPIQNVRDINIRGQNQEDYAFFMRLSLQMYAKLGGVPWRLPSSQTVDKELVIGLGSSVRRGNLWSGAHTARIVGFSTLFLGDGQYVLGDNLPAVSYEDYFETLLKHLRRSIRNTAADYGWQSGDNVRIVFHVFKPLKNTEAEVVAKLMGEFEQYNIVYAFVTIASRHQWLMYHSSSRSRGKTTVQPCNRGENLIIDPSNCLVQLKGTRDRPNHMQRPPKPVKIRLHPTSTFRDMQYLAQQVLDFTFLSWRSFDPSDLPITIRYSELMAKMSSQLEQVDGWNPTYISQHFRDRKWFL